MKKKDMKAFLESKLRFEPDPSGKHESFSIPNRLSIHLPSQLDVNLQHGRGEVVAHIVRQIHNFLGLSYQEFLTGKKCHLSASVIYRSLLWKHFVEFYSLFRENSSAYELIVDQYLFSGIRAIDIVIEEFGSAVLNSDELAVVERISLRAGDFRLIIADFDSAFGGNLKKFFDALLASFDNEETK